MCPSAYLFLFGQWVERGIYPTQQCSCAVLQNQNITSLDMHDVYICWKLIGWQVSLNGEGSNSRGQRTYVRSLLWLADRPTTERARGARRPVFAGQQMLSAGRRAISRTASRLLMCYPCWNINSTSTGRLESIPAVIGREVECTLDRSPDYRRANTEGQSLSHSHLCAI